METCPFPSCFVFEKKKKKNGNSSGCIIIKKEEWAYPAWWISWAGCHLANRREPTSNSSPPPPGNREAGAIGDAAGTLSASGKSSLMMWMASHGCYYVSFPSSDEMRPLSNILYFYISSFFWWTLLFFVVFRLLFYWPWWLLSVVSMFAASACPEWKDQRQKGRHRLRGITAPLLRIGETESQYRVRSEQEKHQTKTSQTK